MHDTLESAAEDLRLVRAKLEAVREALLRCPSDATELGLAVMRLDRIALEVDRIEGVCEPLITSHGLASPSKTNCQVSTNRSLYTI